MNNSEFLAPAEFSELKLTGFIHIHYSDKQNKSRDSLIDFYFLSERKQPRRENFSTSCINFRRKVNSLESGCRASAEPTRHKNLDKEVYLTMHKQISWSTIDDDARSRSFDKHQQ